LHELTEADRKELGLSLGDRKRLLKAIGGLKSAAPAPGLMKASRTVVADAQSTLDVPSNLTAERR